MSRFSSVRKTGADAPQPAAPQPKAQPQAEEPAGRAEAPPAAPAPPRRTAPEKQPADPATFEARCLAVGQNVSDIRGVDLDGRRMKLGDFRGKVVVLIFWASWCKSCMAEVPHEQELLQRWGRRDFAIVGVNADVDLVAARRACAEKGLSWRSFWDRGPDGPVAHHWHIPGWPTFYVIDAAGVIRARGDELRSTLRYQQPDGTLEHEVRVLDQTVERLMNEAADRKKP